MKAIMAWTGGRAPPSQKKRAPFAGSPLVGATPGFRAPPLGCVSSRPWAGPGARPACARAGGPPPAGVLALQRSDAFLLGRGRAGAPALIALGLANPAAQGLRRAADLGGNRADRSRLRGVLALVVEHHPHRTGTDLRKIRGNMLGHGSILPGSGASGKPGAVQCVC